MERACSKYDFRTKCSESVSHKPPPTPAAPCPSAANNPPNSTLRGASQTPDTFSALPPQNTRPFAPSPSNSSPPFSQFPQQSLRLRNSTSPTRPAACPQVQDHPPSSANPDVPALALSFECAHPS